MNSAVNIRYFQRMRKKNPDTKEKERKKYIQVRVIYLEKVWKISHNYYSHTSSIQLSPRGGSVELTSGRFGILRYSVTPPLAERWKAASTPSATATLSSTALTFRCTRAVCKRLAMTRTATTREQPFESSISAVSRECFFGCFFIFTPAFLPEVYRFSTRDFDRYPWWVVLQAHQCSAANRRLRTELPFFSTTFSWFLHVSREKERHRGIEIEIEKWFRS